MPSAEEFHRRGVAASNAGRVRLARQLLERARSMADGGDLLARIELSLAYVAVETGEVEAGRELCELAATRATAPETRGLALSQLAMFEMRTGRALDALSFFDQAIDLLTGAPVELAKALGNRGDVHLHRGQVKEAVRDFKAAATAFEAAGLQVEQAKAEHNEGYALLLAGDLVGALRAMESAYPLISPISPVLRAICEQDRAEALLAAGLVSEGTALLRDAAHTYGRRRLHQRQGEAELTLARTLLLTSPAQSLVSAREARNRFARAGTDAWRTRADGALLAAEVELGRSGPSLIVRGDLLVRELLAQGLEWGAASVRLHTARVVIRRGDLVGARQRIAEVRVNAMAPLSLRLLTRNVKAELAVAEGRRAVALAHLRAGLEELHSWQSSFGSLDLQTMVVGHGHRLARRGLVLAVESADATTIYEWSERARMLASRVQPVRVPADEQMMADLAELRGLAAPEDGARVPAPRRARDEELRTRVRQRAWQLRGSGAVTEPAALDLVRRAMGDDTALVAWVVTADCIAGLVVTGDGVTRHDLGTRRDLAELLDGLLPDLDMAASQLPEVLARTVRQQLAGRLEDLGALLVAPLLERIGDRRVVLTPSGVLAGTPWTLLPGFVGRPVTVAQSATSWLSRSAPLDLVTAGFVAGPRVARAEAEVHDAARRWRGSVELRGDLATADAVATMAARVDVLHIAAHGRHSADNPLFSGVELVGGPWFGYDIDQLEKVPQVVLLSACEVGRSSVRYGEELIGMTAAWLHAGVRCVVASSAAVSDEAAHDVLTAMHAGLASGLDPATALAAAVPAVSEDRPPAPFVCFG